MVDRLHEFKGVKISWLGHDSFKIKDTRIIYVDPYRIRASEKAEILLITHEHYDHCSVEDIKKIVKSETITVAIDSCRRELSSAGLKDVRYVRPGDRLSIGEIEVHAVPAYNVNKFLEPGRPFHPKGDGKVGYIISVKGVRVYHMGDTDFIPEMRELKVDVALVPVSGTYVMTWEEAVEAVNTMKPKLAIPMHYGAIVGSERDAKNFKERAKCAVEVLTKEEG